MPKVSIHRKKQINKERREAVIMYRQGLTLRKVGQLMGKSHQWVKEAVDELDKDLQRV